MDHSLSNFPGHLFVQYHIVLTFSSVLSPDQRIKLASVEVYLRAEWNRCRGLRAPAAAAATVAVAAAAAAAVSSTWFISNIGDEMNVGVFIVSVLIRLIRFRRLAGSGAETGGHVDQLFHIESTRWRIVQILLLAFSGERRICGWRNARFR